MQPASWQLPGKVEVTGAGRHKRDDFNEEHHHCDGSVVRPIPGFETDGVRVVNSDHILELKEVPKIADCDGRRRGRGRVCSVYSRFGAETTIIELMPRLLQSRTKEVSKELEKFVSKARIKAQVDTKLEKLEKTEKGVHVIGKTSKGDPVPAEAENASGRCGPNAIFPGVGSGRHKNKG